MNQGTLNPSGEESVKRKSYDDDLAPLAQNGENPTEWGNTSPSGEDQWGQTSASHSDTWVMSSSWGMQLDSTGEEGCRLEPVELENVLLH